MFDKEVYLKSDTIFVKSFTLAHFQKYENLPKMHVNGDTFREGAISNISL